MTPFCLDREEIFAWALSPINIGRTEAGSPFARWGMVFSQTAVAVADTYRIHGNNRAASVLPILSSWFRCQAPACLLDLVRRQE